MIQLFNDDCLKVLPTIPDKSIDLILTDPPYGTTQCKWDSVIPFEPMWKELKRIIKDNSAIALFGSEPFSSHLRLSNINLFKYDWYWNKKIPSGMAFAKYQPMRQIRINIYI
jgi:DNA modification methylase